MGIHVIDLACRRNEMGTLENDLNIFNELQTQINTKLIAKRLKTHKEGIRCDQN